MYAQSGLQGHFEIWNFYAYAERTRKELGRTLSMRISSLRTCSVHASVPDLYAQCMHQFLIRIIDLFPVSVWRILLLGEFPDFLRLPYISRCSFTVVHFSKS